VACRWHTAEATTGQITFYFPQPDSSTASQ